jgi:NTP pyrophosphatase (non-canonical NTP hydrolase)
MIELETGAAMAAYQRYVEELEALHGWTEVDLVHNCFLMGEEVGELFKAIRRLEKLFEEGGAEAQSQEHAKAAVGEELVDVFNYLLALANRLDIDLEAAFRTKNARNQSRTWT